MIKLFSLLLMLLLSACNGGGGSKSGGGSVPNNPPTQSNVINLNYSMNEDSSTSINLISDNSNFYNYLVSVSPTKGTISGSAPNITYTSNSNAVGTDTFTYSLISTDSNLDNKTVIVMINIAGVNDRPVAQNLELYVQRGNGFIFNLAATDPDGDALTYSISIPPSRGSLFLMSGSQFGYDADNDIYDLTFSYIANDGKINSLPATVLIHVTRANAPPVLNSSANVILSEDAINHPVNLSVSDSNGDILTATIVTNVTHGIITGTFPNYSYSPTLNYNGSDSFKIRISDGFGGIIEPVINLTVQAINDVPVAQNITVSTSSIAPFKQITMTGSDPDVGQTLNYTILTFPTKGTVDINANGIATYNIYAEQSGSDSFTYRISDGISISNTATVTILIDQVLASPVAYAENYSVNENTDLIISLSGYSLDTNLTYEITEAPTKGTLSGTGSTRTYRSSVGETGQDTIYFKIKDSQNQESNIAGVVINISEAPILYNGFNLVGVKKEYKFLKDFAQSFNDKLYLNLENNIETSYDWVLKRPNICLSTNNNSWQLFQVGSIDQENDVQQKIFNFQDSTWTCDSDNKMSAGANQIYSDGNLMILTEVPNETPQIWVGFKTTSSGYRADLNEISLLNINKVFSTNYSFVQESIDNSWVSNAIISGESVNKKFIRLLGYSKRLDVNDPDSQVLLYSEITDQGNYFNISGLYYEQSGGMIAVNSYTNTCPVDAVDCTEETILLNTTIGHGFNSDNHLILTMKYFLGEVLTDSSPGGDLTPDPTKDNEIRVEYSKNIIIYQDL